MANFFTWGGNRNRNLVGAEPYPLEDYPRAQEMAFGQEYNPMPKPNLGIPGMPGAQPQQPGMGQPYGGSQLPGTQVPDLGGYKHPEGGLPTPMEEEFDSTAFQQAGYGAEAPELDGVGMAGLMAMAKGRSGQPDYEEFMKSRSYQGLPQGLLGV